MKIVFTGGGTAGHVIPNIALIKRLQAEGWDVSYIGSENGMERGMIEALPGVAYYGIPCGKLRRYFSVENFKDPFRVLKGIRQARALLKTLKPDVVFSKGGFVSVPVVMAAGRAHIHVVAHESDYTPGLANRIAERFVDTVCVTFEDTMRCVRHGTPVFTGTPIRPELYEGSRERALAFTGLSGEKPVLLVEGGSSGAAALNELLRGALDRLIQAGGYVSVNTGAAPDAAVTPVPKDEADRAFDAAACIGCGICEKTCTHDAVHVVDNVAVIDYAKCKLCRECEAMCPTGAIHAVNFPKPLDKDAVKARVQERQKKAREAAAAAKAATQMKEVQSNG